MAKIPRAVPVKECTLAELLSVMGVGSLFNYHDRRAGESDDEYLLRQSDEYLGSFFQTDTIGDIIYSRADEVEHGYDILKKYVPYDDEYRLVSFVNQLFQLLGQTANQLLNSNLYGDFLSPYEVEHANGMRKAFEASLEWIDLGEFQWNGSCATWFNFSLDVKTKMHNLGLSDLIVEDKSMVDRASLVALTRYDVIFFESLSKVLEKCHSPFRIDFVNEVLWGEPPYRGSAIWLLLCGLFETDRMKDQRSAANAHMLAKERFGTGKMQEDDFSASEFMKSLLPPYP